MTVSTTSNKVTYTGSGSTGPFSFSFPIWEDSDLVVTKVTIATGVEETLTLTTDYTVSLDSTAPSAGSITLTSSLSSSYKVVIRRVLSLVQSTDYTPNDKFPAETHENTLDKLCMMIQQVNEKVDRAIKVAFSLDDPETITSLDTGYMYIDSGTFSVQDVSTTTTTYSGTISAGADADKSATPDVKDIYYATDTNILYRCAVANVWTPNYLMELASGGVFTLKDSSGNTIATIDESGNMKIAGTIETQGTF